MRAAALPARERGHGDGARDHKHVAQVEPFQPLQVEGPAVAIRPLAERAGHVLDRAQRAPKLFLGAERADVIGHDRLQLLNHRGGVDVVAISAAGEQIERVLRRLWPECAACPPA